MNNPHAYTIFSIERRYIFNNLSFDVLNSRSLPYGGLKFEYFFMTHYYSIARCTLIAKVAGPLLSRVTCALLKLLVYIAPNCLACMGYISHSLGRTTTIKNVLCRIVGQILRPPVSPRSFSSSRQLEVSDYCDADDTLTSALSTNGFIVTAALDSAIQLLTTLKQPDHRSNTTANLHRYNDHLDNLNPTLTAGQTVRQSNAADTATTPRHAEVKTNRNESRSKKDEDLSLQAPQLHQLCTPNKLTATTAHYPIVGTSRYKPLMVKTDDLAAEVEFGYDFIDEEPIPVIMQDKPRSKGHHKNSEQQQEHQPAGQALASKKDNGSRTVKAELEAIQRRRAYQLQRKDDSFDKPTSADERTEPSESRRITTTNTTTRTTNTTTTLPLPRDSVIARHRRRTAGVRHVVTSSSSSSRDRITSSSSSSSSRDTSPDKSPETGLYPPAVARRALRRRKRLHDPE